MALPEELAELAERVSNAGRWGAEDQRGTLNLIDHAAVLRGVSAVRRGEAFSLAIPFDADGPQTGGIPGRINPERTMTMVNVTFTGDPSDFTTSDDVVSMGVQAATHWDALSHAGYGGLLYNNTPDSVVTQAGAALLGIEHVGAVATRGLLVDVARLHGVDHFEDAYPVTADDLERCVSAAGIDVMAGDILMVRTGQMHWLAAGDRQRFGHPTPGISTDAIEFFADHDVAAVATDTLTFEVFPGEDPSVLLPVHMICLRDLGMTQGQLWNLDQLAADCAAQSTIDCLLIATPVPLTGSTGGIVVPTAIR